MRPTAGIVAALTKHAPADLKLVVIDSARGLLTADGGEEDRSDDVRRTLGAVAKWQADHGADVAVVAIHHMRRDREARTGDRTRGSGDWLAAVDVVIEFDQTATGAKLTYSGRTGAPVAPLFLTWRDGRFMMGRPPDESASGEGASGADMDGDTIITDRDTYDRVLGHLTRTPADWQSTRTIRERSGARAASVRTALDQLVTAGRIEKRPGPRKALQYRLAERGGRVVPDGAVPGGPEPWEPLANQTNQTSGSDRFPTRGNRSGTGREPVTGTTPGVVPDPIGGTTPGTTHGNHSASGSRATEPGTTQGAATVENQGGAPPDRPAEIPKPPPPVPPAEPPADGKGAASVETESGDHGPAPTDRIDGILTAAERLLGAPDMLTAAQEQIREQAGKDRCRFCGGPPPLELTAPPASLMLCAECAVTHRKMHATTPAELSARVDQHVGGKSIDELWTAAQETAVACIEREFPDAMRDVPSAERLARAAKIARGIH